MDAKGRYRPTTNLDIAQHTPMDVVSETACADSQNCPEHTQQGPGRKKWKLGGDEEEAGDRTGLVQIPPHPFHIAFFRHLPGVKLEELQI